MDGYMNGSLDMNGNGHSAQQTLSPLSRGIAGAVV